MEFRHRMKELRLEHNMTQSQMGEVLGINATMVELIETGEMGACLSDLLALRDLFGVSIAYLVGDSNER